MMNKSFECLWWIFTGGLTQFQVVLAKYENRLRFFLLATFENEKLDNKNCRMSHFMIIERLALLKRGQFAVGNCTVLRKMKTKWTRLLSIQNIT